MRPVWRAAAIEDFSRRHARLLVGEERFDGGMRMLSQNGEWIDVDPGVTTPEEAGIWLPFEAIDAIYDAIKREKGLTTDAATEAKVLRESLEVERGRVDRILKVQD